MTDAINLADKIIKGYRITRGDDVSPLLSAPLNELQEGAKILQRHFMKNHIDFCAIINARSGRCGEDCKYCAQSAKYNTGADEYGFLNKEEIINAAKDAENAGINRFSLVTSGRALVGEEFQAALKVYRDMNKNLKISLCASHGILTREQFKQLKQAGVARYHHNIETSERFFPKICTSHTYEDRINTIKIAQGEGFEVCSGGIIGMGETFEDRINMAFALSELNIKSIPINALTPIKGTPFENLEPLSANDIFRTIAIFRFITPESHIRLAAGRKLLPENGKDAFIYGASAAITGDMLTTTGATVKEDMEMIKSLGYEN